MQSKQTLYLSLIVLLTVLAISKTLGQNTLHIIPCESDSHVIDLVDTVLLANVPDEFKKEIQFTGDSRAVGYYFNGDILNFGKPTGIVLSTGFVEDVDQSNTCSGFINGNTNGGSDADLVQLAGNSINDACVIEFDLMLQYDSVSFQTVFASEEYHEWISPLFSDSYGLFMSGPGINGAYSNNAVNIAEIPGDHSPVGIPNLNCGDQDASCTPPPGEGPNCELLIDNGDLESPSFHQLAFDAYTQPIPAGRRNISMQWYHFKIAIGDGFDEQYDSGVFLESGILEYDSIFTSVHEAAWTDRLLIKPNPAKHYVEMEALPPDAMVTVYDLNGKWLAHPQRVNEIILLNDLPKGLLIIEIQSGDRKVRRKLIHQ